MKELNSKINIQRTLTYLFLSLLVFIMFFHQIDAIEQDLGRHLLLGRIIFQSMHVPKINLLSYTNPDFPFINTHWLSEVIFYLIESSIGFFGLLVFTSIVAVFAFLLQLLFVKKYHTLPIIIAALIFFQILIDRTDVRPEIFSFFFLSITMVVLYSYRQKYTKWIFILPFVEFLWVNIHIYFPIGILVLGLFLLDNIFTQKSKINNKKTLTLVAVLIISSLVLFINPNTVRGAFYPLFVFQNYGFPIEENYNVFDIWNLYLQKSAILYFFISVPLLFLVLFLTIKKTKPVDWFLAITFTVVAASAERNLPLFVFTTYIAFAAALNNLYLKSVSLLKNQLIGKYIFYTLAALFIVWQTISIVTFEPFGYAIPIGFSNAINFIERNNISGPIFNTFDVGSYIAYRLYPKEKVFVDGRPEAYPASFFKNEYIPMEQNKNIFQQVENKYHFNVIINSYTDATPWNQQFLRDINANTKWRLVYLDPLIVIYLKNSPENQHVINTSVLHSAELMPLNLTKQELNNLMLFYENIGWSNEIKTVDLKLLNLDPNSCFALSNLGTLLENENDSSYTIYAEKYQQLCQH